MLIAYLLVYITSRQSFELKWNSTAQTLCPEILIFGMDVVAVWPHIIMIKIPLLTFRNYGKSEAKAEIWRKKSHPKSPKFLQRIGDV